MVINKKQKQKLLLEQTRKINKIYNILERSEKLEKMNQAPAEIKIYATLDGDFVIESLSKTGETFLVNSMETLEESFRIANKYAKTEEYKKTIYIDESCYLEKIRQIIENSYDEHEKSDKTLKMIEQLLISIGRLICK